MENVAMEEILADSEPKQRFLIGSLVEVRLLDKGLRGSWHPAKVLEVHKGKRRVEYEELLEDDEKTKLKEFIPVGRASDGDNLMGTLPLKSPPKKSKPLLRPRPPAQHDSQPISWTEGVWVDCYYDDAWWEGILAENITVVNVDDVSMVTRRSEVDVLFPDENDMSKMSVSRMRIGQEWDEDTGNWSLKGCEPVPVTRPNKKRSNKKDSGSEKEKEKEKEVAAPVLLKATEAAMASLSPEPKATHAAIESELCDNTTELNTIIKTFCKTVESVVVDVIAGSKNAGYGHEERLNLAIQGGESSDMPLSLNVGAQEPVDGSQAVEEPPVEKEVEGNTTAEALNAVKVDVQTPVDKNVSAAKNEEAVQTVLTHAGWKVTKTVRRKTGEVNWNCKTPKVAGSAVKTFTSLLEALSHEAQRGAPGGKVREAKILSQSSLADMKDSVDGAPGAIGTGEAEDANDEFAVAARKILVNAGWEVFGGLRTGSDGQGAWVYRTPGTGSQPRKWFKNWRLALDEYVKQETDVPNQKKRGGRRESSSPVPSKRVTRRLSSSEGPKKSVDASGPSFIKADEVPKSMLSNFNSGYCSDLDDEDKREVDIVMDSGRKRTAVDLSQRFTRSSNGSLTGSSDLEKPFGSIVSFTEKDDAYTLQVTTHNFLREQISVVVEKGEMIIKARYGVEEQFNNIPVRYNGSSSSRMPLPNDVDRQKITAKLESFLLTCTLPKRVTEPNDWLEIKIS